MPSTARHISTAVLCVSAPLRGSSWRRACRTRPACPRKGIVRGGPTAYILKRNRMSWFLGSNQTSGITPQPWGGPGHANNERRALDGAVWTQSRNHMEYQTLMILQHWKGRTLLKSISEVQRVGEKPEVPSTWNPAACLASLPRGTSLVVLCPSEPLRCFSGVFALSNAAES